MSTADSADLIGKIVSGRYKIVKQIGEGGMGRVYLATQLGLEREVAVKVLHAHLAGDKEYKRRFHREARAMTAFSHPGMVAVHDFGEWKHMLYLVMEVLSGTTLLELMENSFPFPHERVIELMLQICDVLAAAHDVGLIHRDLKPENIIIQRNREGGEQLKILDFGLAIMIDSMATDQRITRDGMISGTPYYMSPEHCQGQELDQRADLYALGAILYEMLAGDVPFVGETAIEIFTQHLFNEPKLPSKMAPEQLIPGALEQMAMWALAKDRAERPQSADEFKQGLIEAQAMLSGEYTVEQARKKTAKKGSRSARIEALGVPTTRMRPSTGDKMPVHDPSQTMIVVVEQIDSFSKSITALLRVNNHAVRQVPDLENALIAVGGAAHAVLIVDICPDPQSLLGQIESQIHTLDPARCPVLVVGPQDSVEPMTRALEIGVKSYIPQSKMLAKLPKRLQRIIKRLQQTN